MRHGLGRGIRHLAQIGVTAFKRGVVGAADSRNDARLKVRVFAGQGFASSFPGDDAMLSDGYAKGAPMGGGDAGTAAPQFLARAMKNPIGPALDRIRIIKGRVGNNERHDANFDVVVPGERLQADDAVAPSTSPPAPSMPRRATPS